jgi:hypothetical protein
MTVGRFNREFGVVLRRPDGKRYRSDKRLGQVRKEEKALAEGNGKRK